MNDSTIMPAGERLSRKDWLDTPCEVPSHFHFGPTAECHDFMARMEALGPDAEQCSRCFRPFVGECCPVPARTDRWAGCLGISEPLGRRRDDGFGDTERVHPTERMLAEKYG